MVITGLVKRDGRRWELSVSVRDGKTGKTRDRLKYPLKGPRMSPDVLALLAKEVDAAFDARGGASPGGGQRAGAEPAPTEPKPSKPARAEAAGDEAGGGEAGADGQASTRAEASAEPAGGDADGGAASRRRRRRRRSRRRRSCTTRSTKPRRRRRARAGRPTSTSSVGPTVERPLVRLRSGVAAEVHLGRRRRHARRRRRSTPLASTWKRAGGVFSRPRARRHRRQAVLARLDLEAGRDA